MNDMLKIGFVIGTRPNFVKAASVINEFRKLNEYKTYVIHTGQHYDKEMSLNFLKDLNIGKPNYQLILSKKSQLFKLSQIIHKIEKIFIKIDLDWIFVFGDVDSSFAAAYVAKRLNIKIAHVESGLRSFDYNMPEEINRILIDKLSDLYFITEKSAENNLLKEGVENSKICFVGNTMIDSMVNNEKKINNSHVLNELKLESIDYVVVTLHRPSNVNNYSKLQKIIDFISRLNKGKIIVWPIHPRITLNEIKFHSSWKLIKPLKHFDFIHLIKKAGRVFTDSGGIQEETTFLNIPCYTIRKNTERPVTVDIGSNILLEKKLDYYKSLDNYDKNRKNIPKFWDGKSSKRILSFFKKKLKSNKFL